MLSTSPETATIFVKYTEQEKEKNERELEYLRRRNMNRDTAAKRIIRESLGGASGDILVILI